jgi:hypothetical protein
MKELQIIYLSSLEPLNHIRQTTDQLKEFLSVNHADMQMIILHLDEFLTEQHVLIKKIDDLQKEFLKDQDNLMIPTKIKEIIINQIVGQMNELDSLIRELLKRNFQVSIHNQLITKLLEHQAILTEDPQMTITGMIILEILEGEYLSIGNVVVILVDLVMEEATEKVWEEALADLVDLADLADLEDLKILDTLEISIQKITTLDMEVPLASLAPLALPAHLAIKKMKIQTTNGYQYLPMPLTTIECLGITEKLDGLHQTSINILGIYLVEKILGFGKVAIFKMK